MTDVTGSFPSVTGAALTLTVTCPTGTQIVGAGYYVPNDSGASAIRVKAFAPLPSAGESWTLTAVEEFPTLRTLNLQAYCVFSE